MNIHLSFSSTVAPRTSFRNIEYTIKIVKCLDGHNSVNIDPINPKFKTDINEDVQIGIDVVDGDELIQKLKK